MSWDKNSYKINIYSESNSYSNDFYSFWKIICEKNVFYRIKINVENKLKKLKELDKLDESIGIKFINHEEIKKNFKKQIQDEILKQTQEYLNNYKSTNKFSFFENNIDKELSNYNIAYQDDNYAIITKKNWFENFGRIFIVPDKSQSNRYFIGLSMYGISTNYNVFGFILYFDSDGNVTNKNILNKIVCQFDSRNVHIDETNTILYNQTLLFYQVHRDTYNLNLFLNLLDYGDNLIINNEFYDTEIKTSRFYNEYINNITLEEKLNSRFFHIKKKSKSNNDDEPNIFIDLGSLKKISEPKSINKNTSTFVDKIFYNKQNVSNDLETWLKLDYYSLASNDSNELNNFIEKSSKFEEEYSDGYITYCAKCNGLTSIGTYNFKNITMGLGKSFCTKCEIRYSQSENSWLCCKLTNSIDNDIKYHDTNICHTKLNSENNYECVNCFSHSNIYNFQYNIMSSHHKYPFKKTINICPKKK